MSIFSKIFKVLGLGVAGQIHTAPAQDTPGLADAVIRAREAAYAEHFGALPEDILKMASLIGRWPGGGLYSLHNGDHHIYITSGLSNPDIPALHADTHVNHDEQGRVSQVKTTLTSDGNTLPENGYGYEIMIVTEEDAEWPLAALQWAVHAEFDHNVGLLARVEQYDGVTVSDIPISDSQNINLFIHKAQAPWPEAFDLPNGRIPLLIITVIREDEMNWSLQNGRAALLAQLMVSPYKQISHLQRNSIEYP